MITAWRPCFLAWSSWFMSWSWYDYHVFDNSYHDHGMIIVFCIIFFEKKMNYLSIFSQIVGVIYHYMAHLTIGFRGLRVKKTEQRILQVILEFSTVITRQKTLFILRHGLINFRHILKNMKTKSSSQISPFSHDVCHLNSRKRANIGCSRVWMSIFFHQIVANFP